MGREGSNLILKYHFKDSNYEYKYIYEKKMHLDLNIVPFAANSKKFYLVT